MLGIHLRISKKNWCVNASFQYLILRISVFHQDNMTFDIHLLRWVNQSFYASYEFFSFILFQRYLQDMVLFEDMFDQL